MVYTANIIAMIKSSSLSTSWHLGRPPCLCKVLMREGTFFFQTQGRREVVWVQRGHWPHPGKFLDFDFSKFSKKVSCACFKFSNQKIELFIIWPFGWIIWQSLGEMWGGGNFLGLLFLGDFHQWPACCLHFPLHPGHGINIGLLC